MTVAGRGALGLFPFLILAGCQDTTETIGVSTSVADSAGIPVVTIEGEVSDLPLWELGPASATISGQAEPFLTRVGEVEILSDGRLVVEDNQSRQTHLFAADGTHLRVIGPRGDGPGEFRNLTELSVLGDDSLYAYDRVHDRLTVLHPEDGVVRTLSFIEAVGPRPPLDVWALSPDRYALVLYDFREDDTPYPRRGHTDLRVYLADAVADSVAGPIDVSGEFSTELVDADAPAPFSPQRVVAATGGRMVLGVGDAYDLTVVDEEFTVLRRIRWDRPRRPYSVAEIDTVRAAIDVAFDPAGRTGALAEQMQRLREAMGADEMIPEFRPELGPVLIDADGRLWVAEFTRSGPGRTDPRSWHVLSAEGTPVGRVMLPPETRLALPGDPLVLVRRDELDVEHIELRPVVEGPR